MDANALLNQADAQIATFAKLSDYTKILPVLGNLSDSTSNLETEVTNTLIDLGTAKNERVAIKINIDNISSGFEAALASIKNTAMDNTI
jgi:hypothetical protein